MILVGKIVNKRGLKGDLIVNTFTQKPEDFLLYEKYYAKKAGVFKEILLTKKTIYKKNRVVFKIDGVDSVEEAEKLKEIEVFIQQNEKLKEDDEFFYDEVVDCKVYMSKEYIGKVAEVKNFGSCDVFAVIREVDGKEVYFPVLNDFISSFDLENKKIIYNEDYELPD